MRILMCPPDYFNVTYQINPWMDVEQKVNHQVARAEWENLRDTIKKCGAKVEILSPQAGLPDMVFTANAGFVRQNKIIISHFKYNERQGEVNFVKKWFKAAGFEIIDIFTGTHASLFFEGSGDALPIGKKIAAGYGFRTDREFYQQAPFDPRQLIYCKMINPAFYHLDTCFCPLTETLALWYPDAFDTATQKRLTDEIDLIAVSESEAKNFACNVIVLENNAILPAHCTQIANTLKDLGYTTHICEMVEFLKAGGACKCLTLRID